MKDLELLIDIENVKFKKSADGVKLVIDKSDVWEVIALLGETLNVNSVDLMLNLGYDNMQLSMLRDDMAKLEAKLKAGINDIDMFNELV